MEEKFEKARIDDEVDEKLGFARFQEGPPREGWLVNMHPVCSHSRGWMESYLHHGSLLFVSSDAGEG